MSKQDHISQLVRKHTMFGRSFKSAWTPTWQAQLRLLAAQERENARVYARETQEIDPALLIQLVTETIHG